jgi:hypothetical protein
MRLYLTIIIWKVMLTSHFAPEYHLLLSTAFEAQEVEDRVS